VSSKPVNAAHMTHAYCVFEDLDWGLLVLLLDLGNVDWVLIAPIYEKKWDT
jgi:hypothetical protein